MGSIAFLRNNCGIGPLSDPFRFSCKLDQLANMLLANESFLLVTQGYEEIPNMVDWLGRENFEKLIDDGIIQIVLLPLELAAKQDSDQQFHFVMIDYYPDLDIHVSEARCEHLLQRICAHELVPDGFSMPEELAKKIARKTWASGRDSFPKNFYDLMIASFRKILQDFPCEKLPEVIRGLNEEVEIDENGVFTVKAGYELEAVQGKCFMLAGALKEIIISYHFQIPLIHTSILISLLCEQQEAMTHLKDETVNAFTSVVNVHGLPLIGTGAYSGEITGNQVLSLRKTENGRRFRAWLEATDAASNGQGIIKDYINAATEILPKDSLIMPVCRLIASTVIGIVNTPFGVFASWTDFLYTNFGGKKPIWKPNLFIRGDYEKSLSQTHTQAKVPVDISYLLRRGYRISSYQSRADQTLDVKLRSSDGSDVNLEYSSEDGPYWKSNALKIIAESENGCTFMFECSNCKANCRVISKGLPITTPNCGRCGTGLLR